MVVFLPVENSQRAYKMCEGVKTAQGILPLRTQTKICCKEMRFQRLNRTVLNMISPSTTWSWINIFVDPGTTVHSNNQFWRAILW